MTFCRRCLNGLLDCCRKLKAGDLVLVAARERIGILRISITARRAMTTKQLFGKLLMRILIRQNLIRLDVSPVADAQLR